MKRRIVFTVVFEADMDSVPGWGYQPEDWHKLATAHFNQQSHYNTKSTVVASQVIKI